jgi:hypothetical protein
MLSSAQFLWNSLRGYRLKPWRSPYLRWRVETYTGKKAESLTICDICAFLWEQRWEFLRFLLWIDAMDREVRIVHSSTRRLKRS